MYNKIFIFIPIRYNLLSFISSTERKKMRKKLSCALLNKHKKRNEKKEKKMETHPQHEINKKEKCFFAQKWEQGMAIYQVKKEEKLDEIACCCVTHIGSRFYFPHRLYHKCVIYSTFSAICVSLSWNLPLTSPSSGIIFRVSRSLSPYQSLFLSLLPVQTPY